MKYDVFISYRRDGGYDTAKHLNDLLVRDGYRVSFDIDTLRNGDFDEQLLERIEQCTDFVIIIDKNAFDRTLDIDFDPKKDWLRCELAHALKHKKNIVPVFLSGVTGFPDGLPDDIKGVVNKNGPEYNKYYFNNFYNTLCSRFLKSRSFKKKALFVSLALSLTVLISLLYITKDNTEAAIYVDPMTPCTTTEVEFNEFIQDRLNYVVDSIGISKTECLKYFTGQSVNNNPIDTYTQQYVTEQAFCELYIGMCYVSGYGGCTKDIKVGLEHISKAADYDIAVAQYLIGVCYDNGIGVKQDLERAMSWYKKAAEQGVPEAQCDYGIACTAKNNMYEAFIWVTKAAEQENAKAQYTLAWNYSLANNASQAKHWMSKSAENNYTLALLALANLYSQSFEFQDFDSAVHIYKNLIDEDNAMALYGLAMCYAQGKGVDLDFDIAMEYMEKSAELGYAPAYSQLGSVYLQGGINIPQNSKKAIELYTKAADSGFPIAQFYLGKIYENGWGVKKNSKEARKWYEKAERQGVDLQQMQQLQQNQQQQMNNNK